jgi:outer membrane receptor for ferrienterochelin and colicin
MTKHCFFFLLGFFLSFQSRGQRSDSLKADSLAKGPAIRLNTVTIRGQRPVIERRPDGIIFNVAGLMAIAGSDGADVLRKVPMVSVDGNGGLAVRGSTNVKVFIDGKPSEVYASTVADALRILRGEQIVKIEVVTDPSSRYDAEGTDAVINIITRKLRNDTTNGNVGGVLGNRSENIMGDIHHQHGALQLHGDAFYQRYRNRNGSVLVRDANEMLLRQEDETRQKGDYLNGGFNVLYSLDSLNTLNIGYRKRRSASTTNGIADNYDTGNGMPVLLFQRVRETPGSSDGDIYTIGFNGKSKDSKKQYALLGMYALSENISEYTLLQHEHNNSDYNENFISTGNNKDYIIQADYTLLFNDIWKWETGAKLTGKNVENNSRYQPDAGRSAIFTYSNQIYAAYTNMSLQHKKWGVSGGLRYERTQLDASFKNTTVPIPSLNKLVPQVLVQLAVNDKTSLKLSYAMKLVRPYVSYLDPTVNTSDSLTIQYGNPKLNPEVTNRYQFSYSVNDSKFFRDVMLFFNDNRNTIENVRLPIGNGRFESTWKNLGKNQRIGLSATLNWKPGTKFTLGATLTVQHVRLESGAVNISNTGFMRQLVINASYKLPEGFSLDSYGFFGAKNLSLQGYRSGWKFYNMTLNKKFKNERLNLSLRAETFLTPYTYIDEVIQSPSYAQWQSYRYQNQNLRLTFSYKIGRKEVKSPQLRTFDD